MCNIERLSTSSFFHYIQMSRPFSLSKSSAGFCYRHLQHRVLLTSRQKGRQDPHSEEYYRSKYGDEGSSQADGYGAALTPALLLLLVPSGTGCSFSTVRGPAGQLHWILRIPAWKKRLQGASRHFCFKEPH